MAAVSLQPAEQGDKQLTESSDNTNPGGATGKLGVLGALLEDGAFDAAGRAVSEIAREEDAASFEQAGTLVVAFVEGLHDDLGSAGTLVRVYQHMGSLFPRGHPFFVAFLGKLERILRLAVPGHDAATACGALERVLSLFEPELGAERGFQQVREELGRLRERSLNVIRAHKEQELQALVATGNLDAALVLCREMISEGISSLAAGVLPILEREGASGAAVAYLLAASNRSGDAEHETVDPVSWEPDKSPVPRPSRDSRRGRDPGQVAARGAPGPWRLTFEEVPTGTEAADDTVDRWYRSPPGEATWTSPGRGVAGSDRKDLVDTSRPGQAGMRRDTGVSPRSKRRPEAEPAFERRPRVGQAAPAGGGEEAPVAARAGRPWTGKPGPGRGQQPPAPSRLAAGAGAPPGRDVRAAFLWLSRGPGVRWVAPVAAGGLAVLVWWLYPETPRSLDESPTAETGGLETGTPALEPTMAAATRDPDIPDPAERPQGPPGELSIEIVPPDNLELYLNGSLIPDGKVEGLSVPPGRQVVLVYREGYEPFRKELWVDPNATVNDTIVLSRSPRLNLVVEPDVDIVVRLDGRRMWASPPIADVAIPVGKHRLEVSSPRYKTWVREFEAKAGANLSYDVKLEPGGR